MQSEVEALLAIDGKKKLIQDHIERKFNKSITLKDIHNVNTKVKQAKGPISVQSVVNLSTSFAHSAESSRVNR